MSLHDFQRLQEKLGTVNDPVGFLVNLFAHAPVGFGVWTADGHALLTNQAFMDLFGVEPPPEYNVLKDDLLKQSGLLAYFERAFKGETVQVPTFWYDPRELQIISISEGRRVAISMTIFPLRKANGEIEYVAATYKDETEIQSLNTNLERLVNERTIQLNAVNRELESFSYSVAHDLRSPLRNINGFTNVLLDEYRNQLDSKGIGMLQSIQSHTANMGQLIEALLNLARLTRNDPTVAVVDLSSVARQITKQLCAVEPNRASTIHIQDHLQARMDPVLAWTLLENLISNAWKFSQYSAETRIDIGQQTFNGADTFFVKDNGAGFDDTQAANMFKPFHRLHAVEQFPGTGVGLATARRIVDHYGGKIWGESKVEKGATFFFTLSSAL